MKLISGLVLIVTLLAASKPSSATSVNVENSNNPSNVKFIVECEVPEDGQPSKLVNVEVESKDPVVNSVNNGDSIMQSSNLNTTTNTERSKTPLSDMIREHLQKIALIPGIDGSLIRPKTTTQAPTEEPPMPRNVEDENKDAPKSSPTLSTLSKAISAIRDNLQQPIDSIGEHSIRNAQVTPSSLLNIPTINIPPLFQKNLNSDTSSTPSSNERSAQDDITTRAFPSLINKDAIQLPKLNLPSIPSWILNNHNTELSTESPNARSVDTTTVASLPKITLHSIESLIQRASNPRNAQDSEKNILPSLPMINTDNFQLPKINIPPIPSLIRNNQNIDSDMASSNLQKINIPSIKSLLENTNSRNAEESTTTKRIFPSLPTINMDSLSKFSIAPLPSLFHNSNARSAQDDTTTIRNIPSLPTISLPKITIPPTPYWIQNKIQDSEASAARNAQDSIPKTVDLMNLPKINIPSVGRNALDLSNIPKINIPQNILPSKFNLDSLAEGSVARNALERIRNTETSKMSLPRITLPKLKSAESARESPKLPSWLTTRTTTKKFTLPTLPPITTRRPADLFRIPSLTTKPTSSLDNILSKIQLPTNNLQTITRQTKSNARNALNDIRDSLNLHQAPRLNQNPLPALGRSSSLADSLGRPSIIRPAIIPQTLPSLLSNPPSLPALPRINNIKRFQPTFPDPRMSSGDRGYTRLLNPSNYDPGLYPKQTLNKLANRAHSVANDFTGALGNAVAIFRKATDFIPGVGIPAIPIKKEVYLKKADKDPYPLENAPHAYRNSQSDNAVAATDQKEQCDICNCLMKYLPSGYKNGRFVEDEKDDAIVSASEFRPTIVRPPDMDTMSSDMSPSIHMPNLFNTARWNQPRYDSDGSSSEKIEQIENNIYKLIDFINIVDQFDQYVATKTKNLITRLAKMYGDDFEQIF